MINLLPQKIKLELKQEQGFRLLIILLFSFTVALVCFALMLGIIKMYVTRSLFAQEAKIALLSERFSKDNLVFAEIQRFNETTIQITQFLKSRRSVSSVLESLGDILPSGVYFTSFDYDPPGIIQTKGQEEQNVQARISVVGNAKTRESLFEFRESLKEHPLFSDLSFPSSNWVLPQDVRFSFQINITP